MAFDIELARPEYAYFEERTVTNNVLIIGLDERELGSGLKSLDDVAGIFGRDGNRLLACSRPAVGLERGAAQSVRERCKRRAA